MMPTSEPASSGTPSEMEQPMRANAWMFHWGPRSIVRFSASVSAVESPSTNTVVASTGSASSTVQREGEALSRSLVGSMTPARRAVMVGVLSLSS